MGEGEKEKKEKKDVFSGLDLITWMLGLDAEIWIFLDRWMCVLWDGDGDADGDGDVVYVLFVGGGDDDGLCYVMVLVVVIVVMVLLVFMVVIVWII